MMTETVLSQKQVIYYQSSFLTIAYLPTENCGVFTWKKFVRGENFRNVMPVVLEFIRHYGLTRYVANTFGMGGILPEDQQFLSREMIPAIEQTGIRQVAIVNSESIFNQMAVHKIMQQSASMEVVYFKTFEEAILWIKNH